MTKLFLSLFLVGLLAAPAAAELVWGELPPLPDAFGFGGPAAGEHAGALIVAGGANFPEGPPWEGGQKVWHDRVFVLERGPDGQPQTQWKDAGRLPRRIAYGASFSTPEGVLIVGGEEDGVAIPDVYRLRWIPAEQRVAAEPLPPLPMPASYLAGGMIGRVVYIVADARSEGADRFDEKHFWSLDLAALAKDPQTPWRELPPHPGLARRKAVAAVQALGSGRENLYLISGEHPRYLPDGAEDAANTRCLTDAYRYDPVDNAWVEIAELPALEDDRDLPGKEAFAGERRPVAAATGIGAGQSDVLVFSGSTGRYGGLPVQDRPSFPNDVLAYHTITDTWRRAGKMPVGVVTTSVTRWGNQAVIPSGEVRPGVRTNKVQTLNVRGARADFGALNLSVPVVYLLAMLGVGVFFATRTKSTDDFFRGGGRVPYWVAGLSIFATMLSSITFVALPAKAFATDWRYYVAQLTIIPIAVVVVRVAIPFFRHIDATSAYEYLEKRFSRPVRLLASAQFVMFQVARMAIVMYLPALALAAVTPLTVMQCVLVMGLLSIAYCTLGGVEAVVWTDAIQTIVLMGGLLVAIAVILMRVDGGAAAVFSTAYDDGKLHLADMDFSLSSGAATAVWVVFVGQFFQSLYSYTSDQSVVQRYVSTKDERDARKAMWTTAWMGVFGSLLFFVMGAALYAFYKSHPPALDVGMKTDAIFPWFIATELPVGISGLVVAGVFAAAQSTISTSMNSTATALVTDFFVPFHACRTDRGYLFLARAFTLLLGAAGTAIGCWLVVLNQTSMIDTFISIIGLFGGAVCGLFMLGMLTTRANAAGSLLGCVCGFATVLWVMRNTHIHPFLYAAVGTLVTMLVGYAASLLFPPPRPGQLRALTIHDPPAGAATKPTPSRPVLV
ncbi:Sodium/glucose cotransporter [Pirellulimonas nuda]|uniref:Sodium/glucose cotransporter n=1 Tax=Pirellulimonas nuda TaxID=2528009 RepID=A0A518DG79_9BACT|nr:sodium/solute symporter [Pirellulimonas nuda]QDU90481.1 Sodium/glucose cotransporter [Pirellulimonas nuda]